jgi:excinuclease ABC subunit A
LVKEDSIVLKGIKTKGLNGINLEIPKNKIVAIVGKSGSGKKALVIDTIFYEGYLRYIQSQSVQLKLPEEEIERPLFDSISNLGPVVKLDPGITGLNKSIGDISGIKEDLLYLFSKSSRVYCKNCGSEIIRYSRQEIIERLEKEEGSTPVYILFEYTGDIHHLLNRGYYFHLEQGIKKRVNARDRKRKIKVIIDHITAEEFDRKRIDEALRNSLEMNRSYYFIKIGKEEFKYSPDHHCLKCKLTLPRPEIELLKYAGIRARTKNNSSKKLIESFKIQGKSIEGFMQIPLGEISTIISESYIKSIKDENIKIVFRRVIERVQFFKTYGLGYLSLNRNLSTISNGELQKIQLTNLYFSRLDKIIILIENLCLFRGSQEEKVTGEILLNLKNRGNSLIIISNEIKIFGIADYYIEMASSPEGGVINFRGSPQEFLSYLESKREKCVYAAIDRSGKSDKVTKEYYRFNHQNQEFLLIKGGTTLVRGPAGSGKSLLLNKVFKSKELTAKKYHLENDISGVGSKSNLLMFMNVYQTVQKLMADLNESKINNFQAGDFSFYSQRGRCINCQGRGYNIKKIAPFPVIKIKCPLCNGIGIKPEPAGIKFKGIYFYEFLKLDLEKALPLLENEIDNRETQIIKETIERGMGYLKVGQRLNTLSGYERGRLYLIRHLITKINNCFIILDNAFKNAYLEECEHIAGLLRELNRRNNTILIAQDNWKMYAGADQLIVLNNRVESNLTEIVYQGDPDEYLKSECMKIGDKKY